MSNNVKYIKKIIETYNIKFIIIKISIIIHKNCNNCGKRYKNWSKK